jgi:hypothetical protein
LRVADDNQNADRRYSLNRGRALFGSMALHAALFAGLIGVRLTGEPGLANTAQILRVDLVPYLDAARPDAEPGAGEQALAEAQLAPAAEPSAAAETPNPENEAAAPEPEPTPEPGPEPEVAAAPPRGAEPETPPAPAPTAPASAAQTPTVALEPRPAEPPVVAPEAPVTRPEPETVAIAEVQLDMLDRRITELAARIDLLTDRELDVAWEHRGQTYSATLTRLPATDNMGMDELKVTVSIEQDGRRLSTELGMRRLAFSSFAQFVDRWDPQVQIHDDEIDGRFHSNSEIYVAHSGGVQPAFHGKVTTARSVNTSHSERRVQRDEVFLGGLETRVQKILLPKRFLPFPDEGRAADANVQEFTTDARITFHADGSYTWRYVESIEPERRVILMQEPHYLVAADKATLYLRGTVNGKVLGYSPERIVIEDDLTYAAHPAHDADSDDYLGLVSDNVIEIAEPETTGPGDVTVHAAIYAKRRFVVRNYNAGGHATLVIYGSVAAGSVSATEPRFRTKLQFDDRLEKLRPPSFPLTDRYEVASWDGRWTVEPPE